VNELAAWLSRTGIARGDLAGLAVAPGTGIAVATAAGTWSARADPAVVRAADELHRPRWCVFSARTAGALLVSDVRLATCWDVAAVHRLLYGGWRADPALAWARLLGLPDPAAPAGDGTLDLFADDDPAASPATPFSPALVAGAWAETLDGTARWAELARETVLLQQAALTAPAAAVPARRALACAWSESAAELLSAELAADGLPMDRARAEQLLAEIIGPRPRTGADTLRQRAQRDELVLRFLPGGVARPDLRSPAQVKTLLNRLGVDVPDTRAWRLRDLRAKHPVVDALLEWRKAERIATTYGYGWLDACLGADGRLRGEWTGSDGAAGRMTASAGLHNMPAVLRAAVIAEPGHVFVRADLGQIEPRVLAAVSGDAALAAATQSDDLYAPVATALGVDRPTAKVAVLGAMYGQTTGHGAQALRRLKAAYPVAMAYLDAGDLDGQAGTDIRTHGGRLVRMSGGADPAARGRYGRNALIQGAAAEFFKMWAVTVRARAASGARIVLCLHDELLVHAPEARGAEVAALLDDCLREAAGRWAPTSPVRFIADTRVVRAWSDAKSPARTEP
jgi:DNA polymerase I